MNRTRKSKNQRAVTTAGYSGTPLPRKLGIRENYKVALVNAPADFQLGPLPEGCEVTTESGNARVVVLFTASQAELAKKFATTAKKLPPTVALWIAWPKQASGMATNLKEDRVRDFLLAAGWVDYKVCAIDHTWSGLCFARRKDC